MDEGKVRLYEKLPNKILHANSISLATRHLVMEIPVGYTATRRFLVCFSLVISISSIIKQHNQGGNPHFKIIKEILVLILTLLLAMFLGMMAGMYANHYATQRFGIIAGILFALAASFAAGYAVRWGIGKAVSRREKQFSSR